jgi:ribosomal protein L37AE/L43A
MPIRPSWHEDYWRKLDKKTAAKLRKMCPRCGSANTYYNEQYGTWRCGKCEHSFVIEGVSDKSPWWKRLFRRGA